MAGAEGGARHLPCSVTQPREGGELAQGEAGVGSASCPRVTCSCHRQGPRPLPGLHSTSAGRCSRWPRKLPPSHLSVECYQGLLPGLLASRTVPSDPAH